MMDFSSALIGMKNGQTMRRKGNETRLFTVRNGQLHETFLCRTEYRWTPSQEHIEATDYTPVLTDSTLGVALGAVKLITPATRPGLERHPGKITEHEA